MNEIEVFNFETNEVRTVLINQEVWFVGKDVSKALGYSDLNKAIAMHVDEEDKKLNDKTSFSFGQRGATLINQSGVISLVLSSKLPDARKFKRWVTSEVIPSVMKHGAYMTEAVVEQVLLNPDTLIKLATQIKEERSAKELAQQQLAVQAPKVEFAETIQKSEANISVTDLSKLLSNTGYTIGRNKLFEALRQNGWLLKSNAPSQKGINQGLFNSHETLVKTSYGTQIKVIADVTPKGQEYFIAKWKTGMGEAI
ncbi:BRO family protein [Leuconostoc citreum]|uniref:BRO family protein n=1 Tax=Leuconostoc citreum TaxID=33964 RepID=UPI000BFEADF3|nr:phage antirepressor [Leuconostoc citreum]